MTEKAKSVHRTLMGKVISTKMNKTAVVLIERKVRHPKYEKYLIRSTKLAVHDQDNSCQIGQLVKIEETRPISKTKSWKLVEVIK